MTYLYQIDDSEKLYPEDQIPDYVGDQLDEMVVEDWPRTMLIERRVPMKAWVPGTWGPLAKVLEDLDEEYADPAGDTTKATDAMLAAERVFLAAVIAEYKVWQHEPDGHVEQYDVVAHVRVNLDPEDERAGEIAEWLEGQS